MARFKICFASSAMAAAITPIFAKTNDNRMQYPRHCYLWLTLDYVALHESITYMTWEAFSIKHNIPRQAKHWSHASICPTELKQSSSMQHDTVVACLCCMLRPGQSRQTVPWCALHAWKLLPLATVCLYMLLMQHIEWMQMMVDLMLWRCFVLVAVKIRKVPSLWASRNSSR